MAETKSKKSSAKAPLSWHKENCPCEGKPQKVTARLAGRQAEVPKAGTTGKMKYHVPGSQNRNK